MTTFIKDILNQSEIYSSVDRLITNNSVLNAVFLSVCCCAGNSDATLPLQVTVVITCPYGDCNSAHMFSAYEILSSVNVCLVNISADLFFLFQLMLSERCSQPLVFLLPAALAMGLCVAMIAFVRLPSLKVSCLLLSGLLIYDVFWVRCTSAANLTRSSSTNTTPAVTFEPRKVDDSVYQRLFLTHDHLRVGKIIVSWSNKAIRLLKCKRCGR